MPDTSEQPAVELRNVGVRRGARWILRGIDWDVSHGTCAAILGPNGSGKSTLARVICGYIWPSEGDAFVEGKHFGEVNLHELRQSIRLVQSAGPCEVDHELTAMQVTLTGRFGTLGLFDEPAALDVERAEHLLKNVGLFTLRNSRYETLSS